MDLEISIEQGIRRGETLTWVWQVSLLAAGYVATGVLGLQFAHYTEGVTLIWAPTGLSLAALILFGWRLWPGVFLGAVLVNVFNPAATVLAVLTIAVGNTLEAVVGATLLVRFADFRPTLERAQDGIAFLLIGVLGCTTIGATIGIVSYHRFGLVDANSVHLTWLNWWLGDVGAVLIVTPVLLMVVHGTPPWRRLVRNPETWIALALLVALTSNAFFGPDLGLIGLAASFSPFPVLVWTGIRLGPRGATVASLVMIVIATAAAASGEGPFSLGTPREALLLLWSWAVLVGITAFTLASVVERRNRAERLIRSEETERMRIEQETLLLSERERLTREMHDGLGGQLVSVLAMIERGIATPGMIAEGLRRAVDEIRIVIDSLDPTTTDLLVSLGKLRVRLERMLHRNEIALAWHVDDALSPDAVTPEAVLHLLRIIQKAVSNSLRHSDVSAVEVAITLGGVHRDGDSNQLRLAVRDDGPGVPGNMRIDGRGIADMNSRAVELGANIRIDHTGTGTRLELTIPLRPQKQGHRLTE